MLVQTISAFFATAAFSLIFSIPKKYIIHAGLTGGFGWFIYLFVMNLQEDKSLANLFATLFVALVSHVLARIYKAPVTMFLIPGIIPMVPGAGMFHIVQSILYNQHNSAILYFFETFKMAGAIALGIFIVDTVFRVVKLKKTG